MRLRYLEAARVTFEEYHCLAEAEKQRQLTEERRVRALAWTIYQTSMVKDKKHYIWEWWPLPGDDDDIKEATGPNMTEEEQVELGKIFSIKIEN